MRMTPKTTGKEAARQTDPARRLGRLPPQESLKPEAGKQAEAKDTCSAKQSQPAEKSARGVHAAYLSAILLIVVISLFALNRMTKASFDAGFRAARAHERQNAEQSRTLPAAADSDVSDEKASSTQGSTPAEASTQEDVGQTEHSEITYIGNIKSHVFHTSECGSLPAEKNRILFDSREQAIDYGYRPCGSCNP